MSLSGTTLHPSDVRPALSQDGHVIVSSAYFPPQVTGSSVLMFNLLSHFNPGSYTVATAESPHSQSLERTIECDIRVIMRSIRFSWRLKEWWRMRQIPLASRRLVKLIREKDAKLLVGVYPDYHFLKAARDAANVTGIPWVAYFHDTMAESHTGRPLEFKAKALQDLVFSETSKILVMSQGMADLYASKYGLDAIPIRHTYPEPIPDAPDFSEKRRQGFWSGTIYQINRNAFARVANAFGKAGVDLEIATNRTPEQLKQMGVEGDRIKTTFYSDRSVYLETLKKQQLLVQALDWPDESPIHEQELGTIFPTKTPEYLAAGIPMIVHCPESYFLARFVREHGCGVVVAERSVDAIAAAISDILRDEEKLQTYQAAALKASHMFEQNRVATRFADELSCLVSSNNNR